MSKLIRITVFLAVICSPSFIIYYGLIAAFTPSHEEQFARALTADCKADFERIQTASMSKYGVRHYGTPDYCYDLERNKKVYGYKP